jgi:hypothetical protein
LAEYQELIELAPVMTWRADAAGRCDDQDDRALAFSGAPLAVEDGWATAIHPDDLDRCVTAFRAHLAARTPFALEYRLRRGDGAYRGVVDRGVPRFDGAGAFVGFIGIRVERAAPGPAGALVPICVSCRRARDEGGGWERVERYLEARGIVAFTHTYCPRCELDLE